MSRAQRILEMALQEDVLLEFPSYVTNPTCNVSSVPSAMNLGMDPSESATLNDLESYSAEDFDLTLMQDILQDSEVQHIETGLPVSDVIIDVIEEMQDSVVQIEIIEDSDSHHIDDHSNVLLTSGQEGTKTQLGQKNIDESEAQQTETHLQVSNVQFSDVEDDILHDVIHMEFTEESDSRAYDHSYALLTNGQEVTKNVSESESSTDAHHIRKREKRRHVDERKWSCHRNKYKREKGKKYYGRKKVDGHWKYNVPKPEKQIKERCHCKYSEKGNERSLLQCYKFTEENRKQVFTKFWEMKSGEKKVYINMLMTSDTPKRPRGRQDVNKSRRLNSYCYYLMREDQRLRVCKAMFLNTLGIGEWTAISWKKKQTQNEEDEACVDDVEGEKEVENPKKTRRMLFQERNNNLKIFLQKLPKMESHYCRSRTSKLYLEPVWNSKTHVYNVYCNNWCKEENFEPVSLTQFFNVYDDMNLGIFSPKKDQCSICVAKELGNMDEEVYNTHQSMKVEAREEKEKDKTSSVNKVFTVDLQSVLLCPKSNVSILYYKKKLVVHNFTIFNIKTKAGYCFLWNETEGNVGSNEFATILTDFLQAEINVQENEEIIIYSDGCCSQNRNTCLSNALLKLAIEKNVTIVQKYLERGHTQMEADAMHAAIERNLKKKTISVPADYVDVCVHARQKPQPYSVKYLTHSYFKNHANLRYVNSIRPGKKAGDPTVQDIRALRYKPNGTIEFKLRHPHEWQTLPARVNKSTSTSTPRLYSERLKITKDKYDQLQSMKCSLQKDYHGYYNALPHE